ncbi:MAG: cation transporter [Clostridiales bacterium]|nr:cation transporter [Clostridiales bacterium]
MNNFLIKKFVKNYENIRDPKVRDSYSRLAGALGIIINTLLCIVKIAAGIIFNSLAILADGINNLADASSSIILLIGIKLASKPADKDHPFGHARIEYITGLIISFIILVIGVQLLFKSIDKIRFPEPIQFSYITIVILVLAILIKIWHAMFNLSVGKTIDSSAIIATGADSRNDVISTSAVLISIIIDKITGLQLDGYMGALVAIFIIYSGIQLVLESASPLLGRAPDQKLVENIEEIIHSHESVIGFHDLHVHCYGPGKTFASVHIEINAGVDPFVSHDIIDKIENQIEKELKIKIVAHMDPK